MSRRRFSNCAVRFSAATRRKNSCEIAASQLACILASGVLVAGEDGSRAQRLHALFVGFPSPSGLRKGAISFLFFPPLAKLEVMRASLPARGAGLPVSVPCRSSAAESDCDAARVSLLQAR